MTCQGSVPEAIIAALDAPSWEDAVRDAVYLGGDADTQACIAGGIAEARHGLPDEVVRHVRALLTEDLRATVDVFRKRFPPGG